MMQDGIVSQPNKAAGRNDNKNPHLIRGEVGGLMKVRTGIRNN